MGKDFTNTQTGGTGTTPQTGDKPSKTAEVKKSPGRPGNLVKDNGNGDGVGSSKTESTPNASVENNTQQPLVSVPLESEVQAPLQEKEDVQIPMIAHIDSLEKQEEVFQKSVFSIPEHEEIDNSLDDKASASFGIPDNEILDGGNTEPPKIEEPPKKDGDILSYPGKDSQYMVKDGKWLEKSPNSDSWTPITQRGRVLGLNDYHKMKVPLPDSSYKPAKGGYDVDGIKVYGYPNRPGQAYTIQNGTWHTMKQGDDSWTPIKESSRVKSLNRFHGTSVETNEEYKERGATLEPLSNSVDNARKEGDIIEFTNKAIDSDVKDRMFKALGDKATQAGAIIEDRGVGFKTTDVDVSTGEDGAAIQKYSGAEDLFGKPDRPEDPIGAAMWDTKYGELMPATDSSVKAAEGSKQVILDDLESDRKSVV